MTDFALLYIIIGDGIENEIVSRGRRIVFATKNKKQKTTNNK